MKQIPLNIKSVITFPIINSNVHVKCWFVVFYKHEQHIYGIYLPQHILKRTMPLHYGVYRLLI